MPARMKLHSLVDNLQDLYSSGTTPVLCHHTANFMTSPVRNINKTLQSLAKPLLSAKSSSSVNPCQHEEPFNQIA